jgi:hypothetical protein
MERNRVYNGMVNMRKLTMINPAAMMGPISGGGRNKGGGPEVFERRRRSDRRSSGRRDSE